jgi:hypothetical protein
LITRDYTYQRGDGTIESRQIGVNSQYGATGTTRESIRALDKVTAALSLINQDLAPEDKIDYL